MNLTLRQLRYFLALAEHGSFNQAAQAAHVSQPALSVQIKELEATLNARLVERLPRGIQLTRVGQAVRDRARRIIAEVEDLEQTARWQDGLSGRLQLGVIPTVAPYLLPLALTRLRAGDISLDIRVREAKTDELLDALGHGRIDAAVVALPVDTGAFVARAFADDRFVLAASAGRLAQIDTERLKPDAIDPDQLLLLDEGHCLADQALEVCGLSARRQVDLGAASLSTLCGLVGEGLGLTLLPEIALKTECAAMPSLAVTRFADPEPARALALVRRQASSDDGWFEDLAQIFEASARELISASRALAR